MVKGKSHIKRAWRGSQGIDHVVFCRSCEEYNGKPWEWMSLLREEFIEGREGAQG